MLLCSTYTTIDEELNVVMSYGRKETGADEAR